MKQLVKLVIFIFAFTLLAAKSTLAADFILSPESKTLNVGEEFQIQINLDTKGKEVNGVQAALSFSCTTCFEVKSISFSSLFPSNFQTFDNANGNIQLGSGQDLPTASYNGSSSWVTIVFRAKAEGSGEVSLKCFDSAILELNTSSNLLDCGSFKKGTYQVGQSQVNPTPTSGTTTSSGNQGTSAPSCDETSPSTPTGLKAESGPNNGEITLTWTKVYQANHYSLVFGPGSKNYLYGAADIGNVNSYVVKSLTPGKLYYFAITGVGNCSSSGFSQEVSAKAKGAATTSTGTTTKSKVTPTPEKVLYKPIGEAFPNLAVVTPMPEVVIPTAVTPVKNDNGLFVGLGILLAAIFLVSGFLVLLYRHLRPPQKPPTIMNITSDTPIEPPLNPM
jgi:hypothetical protein